MWNRKELKANARALLKIHYWKALAATIVLIICQGSITIAFSQTAVDKGTRAAFVEEIDVMGREPGAILAALLSIYLIGFLLSVFVYYPLETGAQKLLVNCDEGCAEYRNIVFFFKNSYGRIVKTMFLKWLFTKLWGLLLVIPGIVKSYEYRMVPYLLAENPQMSSREIFSKSREMMRGNKWNAFVLDLSFIGWHILGIGTCGILELFYSAPYNNLTNAGLYCELKNAGRNDIVRATYNLRTERTGKKAFLSALLPLSAAAALGIGVAASVSRTGFDRIDLNDSASVSHGWKYEIRTASGEWKEVESQFPGEPASILESEDYDMVRMSRIMEESLEDAGLGLDYTQCGVRVCLDDVPVYSDLQIAEMEVQETGTWEEDREITVRLPKDYYGKMLELEVYFPETAGERYLPAVTLQNRDTNAAGIVVGSMPSTFWMMFMGLMLFTVAVFAAVEQFHGKSDPQLPALFILYAVIFGISAYQSEAGYYSGLRERVDEVLSRFTISLYLNDMGGNANEVLLFMSPADINIAKILVLAFGAAFLLAATVWDSRKKQQRVPWKRILVCSLAAFFVAVQQGTPETGGGLSGLQEAVRCAAGHNFVPLISLCSMTIIYAVTVLTVLQFIRWRLGEWKKQTLLLERSRFAVKNHELIMRVDEDSRKRNHEMKHHMETLYALIDAGEMEQAKDYTRKVIKDAELSAEVTYSTNIVLNSIVGVRLNQAKKSGIAVQCHIHAPDRLSVDEVDLNILLSNMLENALEACMRMENRQEAHIRLEIRMRQNFLYIECTNTVASDERLKKEMRTVKEDVKNHGFGMEAMEAVAEKYASIIQTEREGNRFTLRTNLCLAE